MTTVTDALSIKTVLSAEEKKMLRYIFDSRMCDINAKMDYWFIEIW